jgi:hypothetical protein
MIGWYGSLLTCRWRKRNLPRDFRRGRPAGVQVRFRCSKHRIRGLLPVGRPGSASLQCRPANNRFEAVQGFELVVPSHHAASHSDFSAGADSSSSGR